MKKSKLRRRIKRLEANLAALEADMAGRYAYAYRRAALAQNPFPVGDRNHAAWKTGWLNEKDRVASMLAHLADLLAPREEPKP